MTLSLTLLFIVVLATHYIHTYIQHIQYDNSSHTCHYCLESRFTSNIIYIYTYIYIHMDST